MACVPLWCPFRKQVTPNQKVSLLLESFGSLVKQIPLVIGVQSPSANYGYAFVSTETKFSLIPGDTVRSAYATGTIFGGVNFWDICKEIQGFYGVRVFFEGYINSIYFWYWDLWIGRVWRFIDLLEHRFIVNLKHIILYLAKQSMIITYRTGFVGIHQTDVKVYLYSESPL